MPNRLETALAGTGYVFRHWGWSHAPSGDYGVFGEDYGKDLALNGTHGEQGTRCFVALFTRDDSPDPRRKVEQALNSLRCPWKLNSVQFERDSGYIHFEWLISIPGPLWTEPEPGGEDDGED